MTAGLAVSAILIVGALVLTHWLIRARTLEFQSPS
jgi:hypothetical protein